MGLCKCPKKTVTNLFCFEHRVNVCGHCCVANHSSCIVQSYLQWLQDSDYDPRCTLCKEHLSSGDTIRLLCLDVFHWKCLNKFCQDLPANTAPAGYTCPMCNAGIFPTSNQTGPIAEVLRKSLSMVNWARTGLGMPLIEEAPPSYDQPAAYQNRAGGPQDYINATSNHEQPTVDSSSVVNVNTTTHARAAAGGSGRMPSADSWQADAVAPDRDENKYKRRSALEWLSRWTRLGVIPARKDPRTVYRRFVMFVVLGVFGLVTLVIIFAKLGRRSSENDPFLDPLANPNIRIANHDRLE